MLGALKRFIQRTVDAEIEQADQDAAMTCWDLASTNHIGDLVNADLQARGAGRVLTTYFLSEGRQGAIVWAGGIRICRVPIRETLSAHLDTREVCHRWTWRDLDGGMRSGFKRIKMAHSWRVAVVCIESSRDEELQKYTVRVGPFKLARVFRTPWGAERLALALAAALGLEADTHEMNAASLTFHVTARSSTGTDHAQDSGHRNDRGSDFGINF